jgi:archaellin
MRDQLKFRFICLVLLLVFTCGTGFQELYAQDVKKNRVRLKLNYFKVMNEEVYFNMRATSKIGKSNVNVSNIELTIYNEVDDERIELGTATTNMNGECRFVVNDFNTIKSDSLNTYNISVAFKGNDEFKKAKKSISYKNADIEAKIVTKDSVNYIMARLKDAHKDSLLGNTSLTVQVKRLFQPLFIGEEFNVTDERGEILVAVEDGIPGVDGKLTIEVVLSESEIYGTVIAPVIAPIGKVIVDESTFDQRKMWSSRDKTPLFLLIFPNLIIFGMWFIIVYLSLNLLKISKS